VFLLLPGLFLSLLRPLPTAGLLEKRPYHHLIIVRSPNSLVSSMSSPSTNGPNPAPNTFDNMRLPAYRSSYLGRYHPYPRTRAPAREVVMVCALCLRTTRICSTDDPYSPIQSAAESERTEENSTLAAENANTVSDLSTLGSRLLP
jgi:hypothetical protein